MPLISSQQKDESVINDQAEPEKVLVDGRAMRSPEISKDQLSKTGRCGSLDSKTMGVLSQRIATAGITMAGIIGSLRR